MNSTSLVPSQLFDVAHYISVCNLESWEEPGDEVTTKVLSLDLDNTLVPCFFLII